MKVSTKADRLLKKIDEMLAKELLDADGNIRVPRNPDGTVKVPKVCGFDEVLDQLGKRERDYYSKRCAHGFVVGVYCPLCDLSKP